ncbi:GNAT family N-acetyltransferase [Chitinophaga varians]|uniref:GNAT family N-acetyltransferase n=1 Tax=Chitinophaga varians TaxID=2202339 RepID=UPI00165F3F83|nr:GNAT family N-acetyltransferase [Chitinophaga varians]MBC9914532.1 GNAT family N-acetyltransferase [Chitinophaga varians]
MDTYQLQLETGNYIIRQLLETEAQLYKKIRLEAIYTEPTMFRCTTPAESELTDAEWEERVRHPRAIFGLFKDDELIGMTSILLLNEEEAYLGQSFIRNEYRGIGLSSLFYRIRFAWASKWALKRLTISHRESNNISKAAIRRAGFSYSYRESVNWLDGTTEDVIYYMLEL